jgi:hypothetical protein
MVDFDPMPQKQILSYQVRGPEIEALITLFRQQPIMPLVTLVEKFVPTEPEGQSPKTDLLREALNFLRAIEFINQATDENQTLTFHLAESVIHNEPFSLQLLRQLHNFDDDRRAFRLISDLVIEKNLLFAHRKELITRLESAYPGSYSWNEEKLRTWQQLAEYLGLVRSVKPDQGDTMFSPQPTLLLKLLQAYVAQQKTIEQISIGQWLDFVHHTYFSCFTAHQEIHLGLARSLRAMQTRGQLAFKMHSDAPHSAVLEGQRIAYLELVT